MSPNQNIQTLASLGIYQHQYPYACINKDAMQNEDPSPAFLAGLCVAFLDSYINLLPDNEQISFETCFQEAFTEILKQRHNYTCTPTQ
jgi:hypothetical protein